MRFHLSTLFVSSFNQNNNVISELFGFVNVQNEEDYYQHHVKYQTYQQQMSRFNDLSKYLENQNYIILIFKIFR